MHDTIERSITITATLERVWDLVTEPGWWVSDRHPRDGRASARQRRRARVGEVGTFPCRGRRAAADDLRGISLGE